MKEEILKNLDQPSLLERLYRNNKTDFRKEFNLIYRDIQHHTAAQIWNERLNFVNDEISWGTKYELIFVIVASVIAGIIAKLPEIASIQADYYYPRNIGFIVFPLLTAYFAWKQKLRTRNLFLAAFMIIISAIYINILPDHGKSDTIILACIHLMLLLWAVTGFAFTGNRAKSYEKRLDYLRYNGDLAVMTAIILISGALLAAATLGLFELIEIKAENFYTQYIAIWGISAAPIVGTYLVRTNPHLVNKVSPIIAKIFTPLVLATLFVYLIAIIYTGKDPYNDREFLLIFNLLLAGVMALILFSVTGTSTSSSSGAGTFMLTGLSLLTIIVNGIALSAIIFRISAWGITPNRLAVLGSNILILTNLLIVTYQLIRLLRGITGKEKVENSIASFLPVYIGWAALVTFVFPLLFDFQ